MLNTSFKKVFLQAVYNMYYMNIIMYLICVFLNKNFEFLHFIIRYNNKMLYNRYYKLHIFYFSGILLAKKKKKNNTYFLRKYINNI